MRFCQVLAMWCTRLNIPVALAHTFYQKPFHRYGERYEWIFVIDNAPVVGRLIFNHIKIARSIHIGLVARSKLKSFVFAKWHCLNKNEFALHIYCVFDVLVWLFALFSLRKWFLIWLYLIFIPHNTINVRFAVLRLSILFRLCVFFSASLLSVCARNARLIQLAAQYQTKPDNNLQAQYKRSFGICMQAWNGYKSLVKISRQWIICHANQFRRRNKKLSKKNWINEKTKKMGFPLLLSPFNLRLTLDIYEKKTQTHTKSGTRVWLTTSKAKCSALNTASGDWLVIEERTTN